MKRKTKLIATLMALCLTVTLGVIGIFAVKTLNMTVGGNITFTADGLAVTVSQGAFKTTSGATYTGITNQTGKLQGFVMDTNTKLSDVQSKIDSWSGLDLVATESLGDPVIHFTITNNMENEILVLDTSVTLGENLNDNMNVVISPAAANLKYGVPQAFEIKFVIKDKSINASLTGANFTGFTVAIAMSKAVPVDVTTLPQLTFEPAQANGDYQVKSASASGAIVIPSVVKDQQNVYPVTEIADNAFKGNTNITSISIPNTVTRIGESAFYQCTGITSELVLPSCLETIGKQAFMYCNKMTGQPVIPESVKTIGASAFNYCSALTGEIVLPSGLTTIETGLFNFCSGLTGDIVIPSGVTSIGNSAFFKCTGLTGDLILPSGLTTLGTGAFGYTGVEDVVIPSGVTVINDNTFNNCIKMTSIEFKGNITSIGVAAFAYCRLITTVVLPDSLTTIGKEAFSYCYSLKNLHLGNGVKTIGESAFSQCNLRGVDLVLPASVTSIANMAFYQSSFTSITVKATTPPTLGTSMALTSASMTTQPIYVPAGSVEAYKAANVWKDFASRIVAIPA